MRKRNKRAPGYARGVSQKISRKEKRTKKQASETQKNKRKWERNEAEMLKMREIQRMLEKVATLKLEKDMSPHGSFTNVHINWKACLKTSTFPIFRMMMAWMSLFGQALQ